LSLSQHFIRLGGKYPPGVLLIGRPDTGKTTLARVVDGELVVPFFTYSGGRYLVNFILYIQTKTNNHFFLSNSNCSEVGAEKIANIFSTAKKL
jgi:ATP-dependent Zn protease